VGAKIRSNQKAKTVEKKTLAADRSSQRKSLNLLSLLPERLELTPLESTAFHYRLSCTGKFSHFCPHFWEECENIEPGSLAENRCGRE
jgi:hypothetical protein